MDPVLARLISRDIRHGTAEVVVYFGDGPDKRSVTRHLIHVVGMGDKGIGRNPDEPSIAKLDAAEAAEKGAKEAYERIADLGKIEMPKLRDILWRMRKFKEEAVDLPAGLRPIIGKILFRKAEFIKAFVEQIVADDLADMAMSHVAANKVRAEVTRTVEFVF
ncbi:MAG: hypothetical protein HYT20_01575 [Candidatus Nealsonbacteria bacterium]|nr:hypothetical protein [Candidatus Nealsonbacteria bacterium]